PPNRTSSGMPMRKWKDARGMTAVDFSSFVDQLATASGDTILPFFRTALAVENKKAGGFDPVTAADRAAEQSMRALIRKQFPDHGILGEEYGSEHTNAQYVWVLDPISAPKYELVLGSRPDRGPKIILFRHAGLGHADWLDAIWRAGLRHDEPAFYARTIFRRWRRAARPGAGRAARPAS